MNDVGFTEDFREGSYRTRLNDITAKHTTPWKPSLQLSHLPSCPCQTLYPGKEFPFIIMSISPAHQHRIGNNRPSWPKQEVRSAVYRVALYGGLGDLDERKRAQVERWLEGLAGRDAWLQRDAGSRCCAAEALWVWNWRGVIAREAGKRQHCPWGDSEAPAPRDP